MSSKVDLEYLSYVCKEEHHHKERVLGKFITTFDKIRKDATVDSAIREHVNSVHGLLQLIKDDDRNLIMHPEKFLDRDGSIYVLDKCKAAIVTMAEKL
jgi:hypothetical protein